MRMRVDHAADAVYLNLTGRSIKDSEEVATYRALFHEIVRAQYQNPAWPGVLIIEFERRPRFDGVAQTQELVDALFRLQRAAVFKIIHRRGADRANHDALLVEHREFDDHPVEIVALHLAS